MSQASDYLENKLVDHVFRAATFAKPAGLYVGLFTTGPSDVGGGTEVAGNGYARVNVPPSDVNWKATQGGTTGASSGNTGITTNAVLVAFPTPTAGWGTVTHFGIWDAPTGGNLLVWSALGAGRLIATGDAPSFAVDGLTVTVA